MIRRLLLGLALCMICLLANPLRAAAFDPFGDLSCPGSGNQQPASCCNTNNNSQSAVCTDKGNGSTDPVAGPNGILTKTVNIIAAIAGIAAVIVIMLGATRFITAGGNSNNVSSAKNTVIYALVGLVVIIIVRSLLVFVINHVVTK